MLSCLGATDAAQLDGMIARAYPSQQSLLGSALDPFADKMLMGTLTVTLAYTHAIPSPWRGHAQRLSRPAVPLAALILLRDAGLLVSSFYVRYKSLKPMHAKVCVALQCR